MNDRNKHRTLEGKKTSFEHLRKDKLLGHGLDGWKMARNQQDISVI